MHSISVFKTHQWQANIIQCIWCISFKIPILRMLQETFWCSWKFQHWTTDCNYIHCMLNSQEIMHKSISIQGSNNMHALLILCFSWGRPTVLWTSWHASFVVKIVILAMICSVSSSMSLQKISAKYMCCICGSIAKYIILMHRKGQVKCQWKISWVHGETEVETANACTEG